MSDGKQHEESEDSPHEAIMHAQEYIQLITVAPDYAALDQALLGAQGYFQTLLQCNLVDIEVFMALNRQALAVADAWQPASLL